MSAKMNVEIIADKPYAVIELPSRDNDESTVNYAVPACTAWLQNITIKVGKDDKQGRVTRVTYAARCRWPLDESKLSDYLEKKKKPTDTWVTYENVKILKFCKSVRQAKEEAEKALDVSDLSQSEKDKSVKRQRFVTRRYSPPINKTSSNRRKNSNTVYVEHSDSSDFESNAPAVRNLKITDANDRKNKAPQPSDFENDNSDSVDNYTTQTQDSPPSKSHESPISDVIDMRYSPIDESVNESIGSVDRIKKKNCNVKKDLERNKQDKVVSEYEKSDDRNSSLYTVIRQTQDTHQIRKSHVNLHRKSPIKTNESYTNSIKSYVPSFSKSHESQISDVMDMRHSPIDKSVNESIGPVDRIKQKNCNVKKDLERNKQDKVVSEYEKYDDRNSPYTVIRQTQDKHQICKSYVNPHRKSPIKTNGSCTNSKKSSDDFIERTIMAAISHLRQRIDVLHVVKIYLATCHPEETFENLDFGIPTLPFTSVEEFYKWEDCHLDEEKKLIIIRLLVEHGRENLKGSVYCIMRKLMTNKVAVNFNLKGTNKERAKIQKKKFQNTMFYGLVIAALKRHAQERKNRDFPLLYNREMSDSHIANWLKDAKKRLENDELRLKKSQQQDEQLENNNEDDSTN